MISITIEGKYPDNQLDVLQSETIALQKSFSFLNDPQARGATSIFDFELPITPKNAKLLGYQNSIYTDLYFLKQKKAYIYVDGQLIVEGLIFVKSVTQGRFLCEIQNPENEWLNFFDNKTLRDVAWDDELCQSLDYFDTPVFARNPDIDKYCMPLIDYGNLRDAEINISDIYFSDIYPAVFVYPLLRDLFKQAGYKLVSKFFEKHQNKYLCIPFGLDTLPLKDPTITQEDVDYCVAEAVAGTNVISGSLLPLSIYFTASSYIVNRDNFAVSIPYVFFYPPSEWEGNTYGKLTCGDIRGFDVELSLNISFFIPDDGLPSDLVFQVETLLNHTTPIYSQFYFATAGTTLNINNYRHIFHLQGGNNVVVRITRLSPFTLDITQTGTATLYITRLRVDKDDTENLRFYLKDTLPDVSCSDFLKDIQTLFNLYVVTDNNAKIVYLNEYEEIRNTSDYKYDDWREKCSKLENTLSFASYDMPKETLYQYASADDFLCKAYEEANGYTYGYYKWINPLLQNNGQQALVQPSFAPTIMGFYKLFYVPLYWQEDYTNATTATQFTKNTGVGLRILKYIVPRENTEVTPLVVKSEYGAPIYNNSHDYFYPTAVFEVDFQKIRSYYAVFLGYTTLLPLEPQPFLYHNLKFRNMETANTYPQGLFALYHEAMQALLANSKIVKMRTNISPADFFNPKLFSRRKLINVTVGNATQTVVAYLNSIQGYQPSIKQLTSCEFLII